MYSNWPLPYPGAVPVRKGPYTGPPVLDYPSFYEKVPYYCHKCHGRGRSLENEVCKHCHARKQIDQVHVK